VGTHKLHTFLLGLWPKIFWCLLRHPRLYYFIEIFYIMEIVYFHSLSWRSFSLDGLDLIVKILWWLGFLTPVSLDPFVKGSPPIFSTHQQEKYLVYFIPLLPSLMGESLRVVISNWSSDINSVLFHIVDCSVLVAVRCFFPIVFPRKSWYSLLFLSLLYTFDYQFYLNASVISLL